MTEKMMKDQSDNGNDDNDKYSSEKGHLKFHSIFYVGFDLFMVLCVGFIWYLQVILSTSFVDNYIHLNSYRDDDDHISV